MKRLIVGLVAGLMLGGCALDPGTDSIFGTKDDYFVNGMIAGKPFMLNQAVHPVPVCKPSKDDHGVEWTCWSYRYDASRPILVIPVSTAAKLRGGAGYASWAHNEIYIVQSHNTRSMLNTLVHELRHFGGGYHEGQLFPQPADQQKVNLETERAASCARLGMACY